MMRRNFVFMAMIQLIAVGAHSAVGFDAPKKSSVLTSSTTLRGFCAGTADVKISGPGIAKNKKISCQKKKFWEYPLVNIYKKIPEGQVKVIVAQGKATGSRVFVKGGVMVDPDTEGPAPQPSPEPLPRPTPLPMPEVGQLDPAKAPGQNFDLKLWKLTLAVDKNGGTTGTAVEIKPLGPTYTNPDAFYTARDGAMVFRARASGATTSGSKYPRSELREMTSSYQNAAWTIEQGGTLSAELAVNEQPVTTSGSKGRIVIGQIHGPDDELCRLYYDNGKLYYANDKSGASGNSEVLFTLKSSTGAATEIPLNARFEYSIVVKDGMQIVSAKYEGITYVASERISSFWPGKALYFKAGVYVQVGKPGSSAGTTGSGVGQVSFYKLPPPRH